MHIPKLGETRCYWTLLNANLQFLFLDPVLTVHMKEQADCIIGRSLLEFVHPDERQDASVDLHGVVEKQALHGTVTRVKYVRASYLRVLLGSPTRDSFPHAKQIGFDDEYLPCDIVINWVADNLVLCFLHAIIDNDERHKSHWTNWCGTITLSKDDSTLLYSRLFKADSIAPPSSSSSGTVNPHRITDSSSPTRVFQILANAPTRKVLFSWPAENYYPGDFGRLAANVRIDSSAAPQSPDDSADPNEGEATYAQARTSCTRRYKSQQNFQSNGLVREVESIFIPHGSVIFACHLVVSERQLSDLVLQSALRGYSSHLSESQSIASSSSTNSFAVESYPSTQSHRQRHSPSHPAEISSMYSNPSLNSQYPPHLPMNRNPFDSPTNMSHDDLSPRSRLPYPQDAQQNPHQWPANQYHEFPPQTPYDMQDLASAHRLPSPPPSSHHPYLGVHGQRDHAYLNPAFGLPAGGGRAPTSNPQHSGFNPRESFRLPTDAGQNRGAQAGLSHLPISPVSISEGLDGPSKAKVSSRSSGQPPSGVSQCAFCGTTSSPEWRKGTTGIKNLCNACGLRYARTRQKEEGYVPTRRRPNAAINHAMDEPRIPANKVAKRASGATARGTAEGRFAQTTSAHGAFEATSPLSDRNDDTRSSTSSSSPNPASASGVGTHSPSLY